MSQATRSNTRSLLVNVGGILCSRVFGLLRDILSAAFWGSTEVFQAAFTTAFSISNTFRSLFAEGAFSAAFVPLLSKRLEEGKTEDAWRLACRPITLMGCALALIVLLGCAGVALLTPHLAARVTDETRCTMTIFPLLLPYALLICLAGAFGAVLNSLRVFAIPSLTPVIFNLVQLAALGLLCACGKTRQEFSSLIWFCVSVLVAGLLQLAVLLLACRRHGFRFRPDFEFLGADVRQLARNFAPAACSSGAQQLNVLADKLIALWLGAAAVGAINYANRLVFLPIGLLGAAMGQACLPHLSRADDAQRGELLETAFRQTLFFAFPMMTILMALQTDVVRLLFQRGAFTEQAVRECVWALAFYLPGLPAFCAVKVATAFHHSRQDTVTTFRISLLCIILNLILNLILCQFLRQGGLTLSSAICSWLNVTLLLTLAARHCPEWNVRRTLRSTLTLALAAAAAGLVAHATAAPLRTLLAGLPHHNLTQLLTIVGATAIAFAVHVLLALLIGRQNVLAEFIGAIRHRR